jgi:hypothetical protein
MFVREGERLEVESQGYNKVVPLIKVILVATILLGFGFKQGFCLGLNEKKLLFTPYWNTIAFHVIFKLFICYCTM